MGKINISMVSSVVELCSKIGFSLLLPIWIGTTGIWFAAPIGYILGIIPLLIYYYSGRWKKLLTVPAAEPAKAYNTTKRQKSEAPKPCFGLFILS